VSDANTLKKLFQTGQLLHPAGGDCGIVDFANELQRMAGAYASDSPAEPSSVLGHIENPKHLIFLLVDGLGMNFIEKMDSDAFIPKHLAGEMRSVFPSTTPTVLTSLATGKWPADHAIMGWHTMLPEIQGVSTIIRFQRCPDETQLSKLGVTPAQAYPIPSRMPSPKGERQVMYLMPEKIAGTVYSQYWSAGTVSRGYKSLTGAVNLVNKTVSKARVPTYTYLYMPQVDSAAHQFGTTHEDTLSALDQVDKAVERLAASLPSDARLIITADHGHLNDDPDHQHSLEANDELLSLCTGPPSGDIRLMYVNVNEGNIQAFKDLVHARYDDKFLVISTDEADKMKLFGPAPFSHKARRRIGNLMVISTGAAVLDFGAAIGEKPHGKGPIRSDHSGLSPDEIRIPVVII
jgi:predicted AlkP superfamily pyrophosphatase or phosphodiesterase